jgi:hypothetical protein
MSKDEIFEDIFGDDRSEDEIFEDIIKMMNRPEINRQSFAVTLSNLDIIDKWDKLWDEYIEVKCDDGTTAPVLKKPSKSFEIYAKDYSIRFNAALNALNNLQANLSVDVGTRIEILYKNLNNINATLRMMYQNSYITFAARPCQKEFQEAKLKADKIINAAGIYMITVQMMIENLIWKDPETIKSGLDDIYKKIIEILDKLITLSTV